ncbi:G kinase-anchoring protein 1-like isoform X1 [Palaemon carinicauda]|uniref:G kinase-anchoring protein 1-like isoform X1 n=1 Tax=Palaemon carinicauda TaxID=392227 RepID=UPI0035B6188B
MASRFAVLDNDVDLDERLGKKKVEKTRQKTDDNTRRTQNKNSNNKKKKAATDGPSLQDLAFGTAKGKKKKGANKPIEQPVKKDVSPPKANGQVGSTVLSVDDDWQRRDTEFVRDENERALREAILLSKLDYEEKKTFYAEMKKEDIEQKGGKVKKKKDKPMPMSLEQFNNLNLNQKTKPKENSSPEKNTGEAVLENQKFFDTVEAVTKKTLEKEARHENYKATAEQYSKEALVSQFEEQLEKQDYEIQALRLEVDSLKNDLKLVKSRNKKLCEVICSAEMKSKAELVVELDKMSKVRDELTQEVSNLSAQLEQERSKVNQLTLDLKKTQGKKKQTAEASNKD